MNKNNQIYCKQQEDETGIKPGIQHVVITDT